MDGRCGPLCQHPGCWRAGNKDSNVHHARQPKHHHYINLKNKPEQSSSDKPYTNSNCQDGFPVLTITDIEAKIALKHPVHPALPHTHKSPIPASSISWPNSSTAAASATPGGSNTPPVDKSFNFVQFVLEDDNEDQSVHLQSPASINDYDFIPVLLWKPNLTKNCNPTKPKIITSQSHTDHDANDNHRARINKMNITGNLPIRKQSVAVFHEKKSKSYGSSSNIDSPNERGSTGYSINQYIVNGLTDVPHHIVSEIIQHLNSQKRLQIIESKLNRRSLKVSSPQSNHHHLPTSLVLDLRSHKVHQSSSIHKSASKKSLKNKKESYSRALASRPLEALNDLKGKINELQVKANQTTKDTSRDISSFKQTHSHITSFPDLQTSLALSTLAYHEPKFKVRLNRLTQRDSSPKPSPVESSGGPSLPHIRVPMIRPFSEDFVTRPVTHHVPLASSPSPPPPPLSSTSKPHPNDDDNGGRTSSHTSLELDIARADLASQTGELLLLNRQGEIIHRSGTDMSLRLDAIINVTNNDNTSELDHMVELEDGTIAPPPTARDVNDVITPRPLTDALNLS